MPKRVGIFQRMKRWFFGSKTNGNTYPDLESSACSECKIMANYIKLTEKALKLEEQHIKGGMVLPSSRPRRRR